MFDDCVSESFVGVKRRAVKIFLDVSGRVSIMRAFTAASSPAKVNPEGFSNPISFHFTAKQETTR